MSEFDNKRKTAEKAEKRNDVRREKLAGFFFTLAQSLLRYWSLVFS